MKTRTASEAKARFGSLLEQVKNEPVTILRNGRPIAVISSREEPQRNLLNSEQRKTALDFLDRWTAKPASENLSKLLEEGSKKGVLK